MLDEDDGRFRNRGHLIDPSGAIVARCDRIHLFDVDLPGEPPRRDSDRHAPGANRVEASHRTWVPTDEFLEAGHAFARGQEFDERHAAYRALLAASEDVTPALYLWRNVQSFAMRDGISFDPGSTQVTVFDDRYMTVSD